jgi:hypothetical protein
MVTTMLTSKSAVRLYAVALTAFLSFGPMAQGQFNPYPQPPFLPRDPKDCDAYGQEVAKIKADYNRQHDDCLSANSRSPTVETNGNLLICSKSACQGLHDVVYGNFGKNADAGLEACRQAVEAYQQEQRAEKAAQDKAAADNRAARDTQRIENEREDSKAMQAAQRQAEQAQAALAMRTEERNREIANLTTQGESARQALAAASLRLDQLKDSINTNLSNLIAAAKSAGSTKTGTDKTSDMLGQFNLDHGSTDTKTKLSEVFSMIDPLQKLAAPFAAIPYAILKNSVLETGAAIDKLGDAITHFDTVDSRQVESIVDDFGKETFSPKAFADVYYNFYKDAITDNAIGAVTEPIQDALKEKADDILGYGSTPRAELRQWYESPTARAENPNGPIVLVDRSSREGGSYLGVASSVNNAELERLIAEGDSVVLPSKTPEWTPAIVYFLPGEVDESTLAAKLKDFAPGELWGAVDIAWKRRQDALGNDK